MGQSINYPTMDWQEDLSNKLLNEKIKDELLNIVDDKYPSIRGLLLIKEGEILFEKYRNGFDKNSFHEIHSVTKNFISALIGILISKKKLFSVDEKVSKIFPEFLEYNSSEFAKDLKVKHLLTMTSGFDWNDDNYNCWLRSKDRIKSALSEKFINKPGEKFSYDNRSTYLLSGIIDKFYPKKSIEFANNELFKPLGIKNVKWETDSNKILNGGTGLLLSSREIAKLGFLYMNDGDWEGKNIIDKNWIEESVTIKEKYTNFKDESYGYLWWIKDIDNYKCYFARGYGGQLLYVIPELDVIFVITSSAYSIHPEYFSIISDFILKML
jgi:CubicO group peptidase (beta-lactamase class C family)